MTLALGITDTDGAPAEAIVAHPGHLALVTASSLTATAARARLALQVAHASELEGFLCFKPREPVEVSAALEHVASASADLTAQLEACRGKVQFTLAVTPPAARTVPPAGTWLRQRAASANAVSAGTAALADLVRSVTGCDIRCDLRRGLVHVIGDRRIGTALADAVSVPSPAALTGYSVAVTGPWPVFARLDEGSRT
ncbi:MAG: hypothetical protein ACOCYW_03880 [Roseicyclus sp.]